jgi:hypothetical protein
VQREDSMGLMVMSASVLSRRLWTEGGSTRVSKQGIEAMMDIRKKGEREWLIPHRPLWITGYWTTHRIWRMLEERQR